MFIKHTIRQIMKNLLILIVAIALFLHFKPQPELTKKFEEYKEKVLSIFSEATDTKVRLRSDKIFKDLESKFESFSAAEIEHLKEITLTRKSVKQFYTDYCYADKGHPTFHSTNLAKVCNTINNYQSIL